MKIKQADEVYRNVAPYLFENEDDGHRVTVEPADPDGDVYLHLAFARYVNREDRERRATSGWANADRSYEWSGKGQYLTRAQALKLARRLIKAAESGV